MNPLLSFENYPREKNDFFFVKTPLTMFTNCAVDDNLPDDNL